MLDCVQPKFVAQTTIEQRFETTADKTQIETQIQDVIDMVPASWLTQESRSAPELTSMNLKEHNELTESCSDSYTSTCTTTTTTSDEYQRMYSAQTSLLQCQSYYDQSSVDLNSSNCDYEVLTIQQQQGSFSSGSTDFLQFSGRRSAQECSESICNTINTTQLVDYLKDSGYDMGNCSHSPLPKLPKKVGFSENITKVETDAIINSGSQPSSIDEERNNQYEQNIEDEPVAQEPDKIEPPFDRKTITPSPNIINNATPKEWQSLMVQALTTASDKPFSINDLPETVADSSTYVECFEQISTSIEVNNQSVETQEEKEDVQSVLPKKTDEEQSEAKVVASEEPSKKGFLGMIFKPVPHAADWFKPIYESVPLPEQTEPYFPPNIPLLPIEKHEPLRTKSPFVEALTVAPLRPFTPFENDVISQIEGLPRAPPEVKLIDALTTAPERPITKLNPDLPDETEAERIVRLDREKAEKEAAEVKAFITKTIDEELSKKCTTFAPFKGYRKVDPFNPLPSLSSNPSPHCQSRSSSVCAENQDKTKQITDSIVQTQNTRTNKACHNQSKDSNRNSKRSTAFPPPPGTPVKSYVQSGLQSPKTIPKYQRQWFNLPSQSPIRTPEPHELKENVPLAFIDVPHEKTDSVSKPIAITISATASTTTTTSTVATESAQTDSTIVASDVKKTIVTSSVSSESASTTSTIVPALPENRSVPITMSFQSLDPKEIIEPIRSTTPSLINKPPPMIPYYQQNLVCEYYTAPNSFTFDPSNRTASPRPDAIKSPAPGPPPNLLKIHAPRIATPDSLELSNSIGVPSIVTGKSGGQVLASSKRGFEASSHSFVKKPDVYHREQKNGLSIESHTTGAELNEAKKSDVQTSSTVQIGNTQVQRNRRVVEEFEHTQKSSTTEIHTSGHTNASQLQQNIASGAISSEYLTELPYGKGFVARQARRLSETPQSSKNVVSSYRFPQISPEPIDSAFPLLSSNLANEPATPKVPTPQPIQVIKPSAPLPSILVNKPTTFPLPKPCFTPQRGSPLPQCASPVPQKISFPPPFDVGAFDEQFGSLSSNVTATASLTTQYQSSAYQSLTTAGPSAFLPNPNYGSSISKPISSSTSIPGAKPSNFNNNQNTVSVSDPTPASAGPSNKSLSNVGATSAPKRGRGVLNASVAPGGRIPKCGCCTAQIR